MTHTQVAVARAKAPFFIALAALGFAVLTGTDERPWADGFASCWQAMQPIIDQLPTAAAAVPVQGE